MVLSKAQQSIWEKARTVGSGGQARALSDAACAYLVARIALDLGFAAKLKGVPKGLPDFFSGEDVDSLVLVGPNPLAMFEKLVTLDANADTYFACLAALHKARLKYERILETQPIPTLEQVGPRGLLQYGKLSPPALAAFLFWRKWFYDLDNRAGQETGYLFEPVIAYAVGGTPVPANKSPVRRHDNPKKGRQVDCLLKSRAYEFKIRVTIAASGQGRWREELEYPIDCKTSGYKPVLIVLDSTPNPKLKELAAAFRAQKGEVFTGDAAWQHLEGLAGKTMAKFLDKYVRAPLKQLIEDVPDELPPITATMTDTEVTIAIERDTLRIKRCPGVPPSDEEAEMPEDVADEIPGP